MLLHAPLAFVPWGVPELRPSKLLSQFRGRVQATTSPTFVLIVTLWLQGVQLTDPKPFALMDRVRPDFLYEMDLEFILPMLSYCVMKIHVVLLRAGFIKMGLETLLKSTLGLADVGLPGYDVHNLVDEHAGI